MLTPGCSRRLSRRHARCVGRLESLETRLALTTTACPWNETTQVDAPPAFVTLLTNDNDGHLANEVTGAATDLAAQSVSSKAVFRWSDQVSVFAPRDQFRVNIPQASNLKIDVSGQRSPLRVTLQDSQGRTTSNLLATDQAGWLLSTNVTSGSYTLTISATASLATSYLLTIELTAPSTPAPTPTPTPTPTAPTTPAPTTPKPTTPPATSTPTTPTAPSTPTTFADVPDYGGANDWNLNAVRAPESWAAGYTGQGVVVAVVDTGVDWRHADLQSAVWQNTDEIAGDGIDNDRNGYVDDIRGWNFVDNNANVLDLNGHGTHVSGTIVANRNNTGATGVAYGADVMPIRVLGANGAGTDYGVAQGIRYAVDNGADIVNLSLGSSSYSSILLSALNYAASHDVLIVAASGNEGASTPGYPARFSGQLTNIVSVGAHDRNNRTPSFSNAVGNVGAVQVSAPGADIYSTMPNNQYGRMSGTSMATPHVAGLAALILSANPGLTAAQIRSLLVGGANRAVGASGGVQGVNAAVSVARSAAQAVGTSTASTSSAASAGSSTPVSVRRQDLSVSPWQAYLALGDQDSSAKLRRSLAEAKAQDVSLLDAAFADLVIMG